MTLADTINAMIRRQLGGLKITSANPNWINEVYPNSMTDEISPDLENEIKLSVTTDSTGTPTSNIQNLTKKDAKGIISKAGIDPESLITAGLKGGAPALAMSGLGKLGSFASMAFPPAIIAVMAVQLIPEIIKGLKRPGGFLDTRLKIDARNEAVSVLDRQTRQNTRIGDRQVIVQQFEGFRNFEGFASTNTRELIRENADRVTDIGLFDRAQGVI